MSHFCIRIWQLHRCQINMLDSTANRISRRVQGYERGEYDGVKEFALYLDNLERGTHNRSPDMIDRSTQASPRRP